jgi:hypothetical protein
MLFVAGRSYVDAMVALETRITSGEHSPAMPFYLLAGFAVELVLKSAVQIGCYDNDRTIMKLGHDLSACYSAALAAGYKPSDEAFFRLVIDQLSPSHKLFQFRYVPEVDTIRVPSAKRTLDVVQRITEELESSLSVWEQP